MPLENLLRTAGPLLAAAGTALAADLLIARRDPPPGFASPWRRATAAGLLGAIFYAAVFAPLGALGLEVDLDLSQTRPWELFSLHALLVVVLAGWGALAYAGRAGRRSEGAAAAPSPRRLPKPLPAGSAPTAGRRRPRPPRPPPPRETRAWAAGWRAPSASPPPRPDARSSSGWAPASRSGAG